jgi:putative ABC transport system permease protein
VTQAIDRNDMSLVVRAEGDPTALAGAIRDTARSIDPSVMVWRIRAMDELVDDYLAPRRLSLGLVQGFAAVALALALIGIYGVLSYTVSQRVPEIGVRMALGAGRGQIVRMTLASGVRLSLIGIAAGVAVSMATSRILDGLLFGVEGTDVVTYASVIVLMLVAALAACAVPAIRAARVNPLSAVRAE